MEFPGESFGHNKRIEYEWTLSAFAIHLRILVI